MDNLIKDNKCMRAIIRGTEHIDSISAGETKVITITFDDFLDDDAVCVTTAHGWPLESSVQSITDKSIIISVTNQSGVGIANVDLAYLVM